MTAIKGLWGGEWLGTLACASGWYPSAVRPRRMPCASAAKVVPTTSLTRWCSPPGIILISPTSRLPSRSLLTSRVESLPPCASKSKPPTTMAAPRTPGARKVHRVPLVELDSGFLRPLHRQQAPAPAAAVPPRVPANAAPQAPEPLPSPALLFEMEGLEEALPAQEPVTDSARRTLETVARLLAPGDHTVSLRCTHASV